MIWYCPFFLSHVFIYCFCAHFGHMSDWHFQSSLLPTPPLFKSAIFGPPFSLGIVRDIVPLFIWPKCAQKRYINTCERKKESHHIIYSRATPLIYIVMNREKEEEEEAPILYYGKGRVGTTINDKISWTFPSSSQVVLWLRMVWWYVRLAFPK